MTEGSVEPGSNTTTHLPVSTERGNRSGVLFIDGRTRTPTPRPAIDEHGFNPPDDPKAEHLSGPAAPVLPDSTPGDRTTVAIVLYHYVVGWTRIAPSPRRFRLRGNAVELRREGN